MSEPKSIEPSIALSIRQPWAWLIVNGYKGVENRTWPTKFRGRVLIHAGSTLTKSEYYLCARFMVDAKTGGQLPPFNDLKDQCGGIVGEAEVADCVTESKSPWFVGPYGFVLRNQRVLPFQKCKGMLGFFQAEYINKNLTYETP